MIQALDRVWMPKQSECLLCRAIVNREIEMKILRVVPSQDKILVDSEQRFSPWWWPSALLSPLGWQHHIIMTTVENPAGCANPAASQALQMSAPVALSRAESAPMLMTGTVLVACSPEETRTTSARALGVCCCSARAHKAPNEHGAQAAA